MVESKKSVERLGGSQGRVLNVNLYDMRVVLYAIRVNIRNEKVGYLFFQFIFVGCLVVFLTYNYNP